MTVNINSTTPVDIRGLRKHLKLLICIILPIAALWVRYARSDDRLFGTLDAAGILLFWMVATYLWWPRGLHPDLSDNALWYQKGLIGILKVALLVPLAFALNEYKGYPYALVSTVLLIWLYLLWAWGPRAHPICPGVDIKDSINLPLARRKSIPYLLPLVVLEVLLLLVTVTVLVWIKDSVVLGVCGAVLMNVVFVAWCNRFPATEMAWAKASVGKNVEGESTLFYDNQLLWTGGSYSIGSRDWGAVDVVDSPATRQDLAERFFNLARVRFDIRGGSPRELWLLYRGAKWPKGSTDEEAVGRGALTYFFASLKESVD